jgi:DNA-binding transcriptional ArsR family regulator
MSDAVFHAIAEPRRRLILRLIQSRELSAGEIAEHFEVTQPAISQHLRVLVEAQLVIVRRQGTRRLFRARPEGLEHIREFLESFWDSALQELKHLAEDEERGVSPYGRN